ncbi:hypothetical protein QOT17_023221 [Balamuthia mandrillaris]
MSVMEPKAMFDVAWAQCLQARAEKESCLEQNHQQREKCKSEVEEEDKCLGYMLCPQETEMYESACALSAFPGRKDSVEARRCYEANTVYKRCMSKYSPYLPPGGAE